MGSGRFDLPLRPALSWILLDLLAVFFLAPLDFFARNRYQTIHGIREGVELGIRFRAHGNHRTAVIVLDVTL